MNPTDFIRKHITAALTAEGFAPSVVQGGSQRTGALPLYVSVNQKGKLLCGLPFSSPAMGSWADNDNRTAGKEKAGKVSWREPSRPVLTSLVHTCCGTNFKGAVP